MIAARGLALAILLGGCTAPEPGSLVQRPLKEFQHSMVGVVKTVDNIQAECGKNTLGCFRGNTMILLNPCLTRGWYADTFCHEQAHKNGWRHK